MSQQKDLTRWNRAGKNRFRYIDGNAVEYLEMLRQQLAERFADRDTGRCDWLTPPEKIPANEIKAQDESLIEQQERLSRKQKRILEMYHQDRRDWSWEISRTFARACHILTEYADAYANEGFLGTATQWDHVRRLVEMLDYHPAPPASASTHLAIIAKENKTGIVGKGFQLKNSPAGGSAKVVFETLADLFIDPALNELRPRGWDKSDEPALPQDGVQSEIEEQQYSVLANGSAINLQGVGKARADQLNTLPGYSESNYFRIKDFLGLNTENFSVDIGVNWIREFRAKATVISNFELTSGWSSISAWLLPDIASEKVDSLAEVTGVSLDEVKDLQLRIALISSYLDHGTYKHTKLKDLLAPVNTHESDVVSTLWCVKQKAKVAPGQVAMIFHKSENKAEAVTIASVNETNTNTHLQPSPVQYSWGTWPKGDVSLKVSSRWQRKCWLNGDNVIRTVEPHGLSAGAYISWKKKNSQWTFVEVIEVDEKSLRLNQIENLPESKALIYEAIPLEESKIPADMEEYGAVTEESLAELVDYTLKVASKTSELFTLNEPNDDKDKGNVPPLMPPGKLGFGSFLFPSPMLPMDLVMAAVDLLLSMGIMVIPGTGTRIFKFLDDPESAAEKIVDTVNKAIGDVGGGWLVDPDDVKDIITPSGTESVLYKEISSKLEKQLKRINSPLLGIRKDAPVKAVVASVQSQYVFNGSRDKIENGDWVVGQFSDGLRALKISAINGVFESDKSEGFSLSFKNLLGNEAELQKLYADFRGELIAEDARINNDPIDSDEIELESVPDSLKVGRAVLIAGDNKVPVAAKIKSIDGNTIKMDAAVTGFTKGGIVIHGNVVAAGHGISKPEKILGSGSAVKSNQEFVLEVEAVSFTPDPAKSSGVAAAIEVDVAGQTWQQVSTLKDSSHSDHHYAIRMTEQGYVKILFGDGENGRRLPTGKNNIRVRFRVGSGLTGNVPKHRLEKPVSAHSLIEAVQQPVAATGGGNMEDITSLRENAPPNLLALERAVSLSDFSHLAAAQSSVWQAKAYRKILHGGRMESVQVIIVPAGGVVSPATDDAVRSFLQKHALPGILIGMENYIPDRFHLSITVRIKINEFIAEEVEMAVVSALTEHFMLRNRRLGKNLYLSEVYKIVEGVKGVENSICILNENKNLKLIKAANESTVLFLDTNASTEPSTLNVDVEEYLP